VRIDQLALRRAPHQRLKFVLTVDVHQQLAELAQSLQRHHLAIDERARTAIAPGDPAQDAFTVALDLVRRQPGKGGFVAANIESRAHLGALAAVTHDIRRGAATARQRQGIDDDGLARTGFAGERNESRAELELELVDDGEVADSQESQQARALARSL
jgi:hypothetical protein